MTLLDAPKFDTARDRRRRIIIFSSVGVLAVFIGVFWLAAGMPFDWPWTWNAHRIGTIEVDRFLKDVEKDDMAAAYGVWYHDKDWQQHPDKYASYSFDRFKQDWSPTSSENDYGAIKSHVLKMAHMYGNVLVVAIFINDRKSKALFLDYDTRTKQLGFSPVEYYLGP
jgi:hypothetical protein